MVANKKWTSKRKNLNLPEQDVVALENYCQKSGRTEAEVMREALRRFLKQETAELVG